MYAFFNGLADLFITVCFFSGIAIAVVHLFVRKKTPAKGTLWKVFLGTLLLAFVTTQIATCSMTPEDKKAKALQEQQEKISQEITDLDPSKNLTEDQQKQFTEFQNKATSDSDLDTLKQIKEKLQTLNKDADEQAAKKAAEKQAAEKAAQEQAAKKAAEEQAAKKAAEEQAAQEQAAKQAAEEQAAQEQAAASQEAAPAPSTITNPDTYACMDGTQVPGTSDPHAKGEANACYGHGGFEINHE